MKPVTTPINKKKLLENSDFTITKEGFLPNESYIEVNPHHSTKQ